MMPVSIFGKNMTLKKRDVPQSVFDSPEAIAVARRATREATEELARTPRHLLDEGNPSHPRYDLHLFGQPAKEFMQRQYK
jgi:hypothetical protein